MASCDGDSDSSHATGSCSPSDSVHDVPRGRHQLRQRLSGSTPFAGGFGDLQPTETDGLQQAATAAASAAAVSSPFAGWCAPPLLVARRSATASVLPELLGSDAYCRLAAAAAAAASINGIYWGRRCDEKPCAADLLFPWHASACFNQPEVTPIPAPSLSDSDPVGAVSNATSWIAKTMQALQTEGLETGGKATMTPDSSASPPPSVDDLPLDLSPVAKRVCTKSPPHATVDGCSV